MNMIERAEKNLLIKTGEKKKLTVRGQVKNYDVYEIPLEFLYYNDQNGRINTMYKKYSSTNGFITPEIGDSEYNKIFEDFIFDSNKQAMRDTIRSIKEKSQQEPGVVLPDGRVIDGNRRLTALRIIEKEEKIPKTFNAVILPLNLNSKIDEKTIKELELDLQLGREERVNYDPIDRIFDVYNTIKVQKLMNAEEYKKASGAKNTRGINRDIRLAELVIKFIKLVSPDGNPIDKFYLARDLKLDGPIEEIESTINKLVSKDKESIKDAVLVYMASSKVVETQNDTTRLMRDLKNTVIKDPDRLQYFLDAVDDKVDDIVDAFQKKPIQSANELKTVITEDDEVENSVYALMNSTDRIISKGKIENERTKALIELENIRDSLAEIDKDDFLELTADENLQVRDVIIDIKSILYRLVRDI